MNRHYIISHTVAAMADFIRRFRSTTSGKDTVRLKIHFELSSSRRAVSYFRLTCPRGVSYLVHFLSINSTDARRCKYPIICMSTDLAANLI